MSYPDPDAQNAQSSQAYFSPSPSHNDDLQLTAQLSRGIAAAPMMNNPQGGNVSDNQDQHVQVQEDMNSLPQYPQQHLQPHPQHGQAPMAHMGGQYESHDSSIAARKRSKVSRACDECRRKKIRCDATTESGQEACSSCKRVNATCMFTREPMKRGPSKGYIKDLADRLQHLEGAVMQSSEGGPMQPGEIPSTQPQYMAQNDPQMQRRVSNEYSPPPMGGNARKRTHSAVTGDLSNTYPQRPMAGSSGWSEPMRPGFGSPQSGPGQQQVFRDMNYSPNGLPPNPQWRCAPEPARQPSVSEANLQEMRPPSRENVADLDDQVLNSYFTFIHPTYPLLSSRVGIMSRLASCGGSLKDAFIDSLYAAVSSFTSADRSPYDKAARNASNIITQLQLSSSSTRSLSSNIVFLQTILLMVIEASNQTSGLQSGYLGPSPSVWLGIATVLAHSLKLYEYPRQDAAMDNDSDSDQIVCRRIWWSLVIMDRWHGSSTATRSLIPDSSAIFQEEDEKILGLPVYQLARLSIVLGHCAEAALTPAEPLKRDSLVTRLLKGELERLRESIPSEYLHAQSSAMFYLGYWSLRIFAELATQATDPTELMASARQIVAHLTNDATYISPIVNNCSFLAAVVMIDLSEYEQTKAEAENALSSLLDRPNAPWNGGQAIRHFIMNRQQKPSPSKQASLAIQGLQLLRGATNAIEGGMESTERKEEDIPAPTGVPLQRLREIFKGGYLSALGGDAAR